MRLKVQHLLANQQASDIPTALPRAEDTREETEIIEIAKQPSENEPQDPFITSSLHLIFVYSTPIFADDASNTGLETAEGNEMPRDTKTIETGASDDGEEMAHEIKCTLLLMAATLSQLVVTVIQK